MTNVSKEQLEAELNCRLANRQLDGKELANAYSILLGIKLTKDRYTQARIERTKERKARLYLVK